MKQNIRAKDRSWKHYHKRSVAKPGEIPPFIGWDKLLSMIDACNQLDYDTYYRDYCIERDKGLIATLFECGGRIGEVVALTKANFDFTPKDYCIVSGMLLEKRFEKIGKYLEIVTEEPTGAFAKLFEPYIDPKTGEQKWQRERWRTTITSEKVKALRIRKPFPIFKNEPLYPIMEAWINHNHSAILFPSPKTRKNGTRFMTITNAWIIINRIQKQTGIDCFPHWFRSQRASQLFYEYGCTWAELKLWFSWESEKTAALYTKGTAEDLVTLMLRKMQQQIPNNITKIAINQPSSNNNY